MPLPEEPLYRIKFKATPSLRQMLYRKGGKAEVPYGKGTTWKAVAPEWFTDGAEKEVPADLFTWCLNSYPDNFSEVKPKSKPKETDA